MHIFLSNRNETPQKLEGMPQFSEGFNLSRSGKTSAPHFQDAEQLWLSPRQDDNLVFESAGYFRPMLNSGTSIKWMLGLK